MAKENSTAMRWLLFVVLGVSAVSGFWFGARYHVGARAERTPYRELEKFSKVLQFVEANYVETAKSEDLIESAIKGMLAHLDPHSSYLPGEIFKEMKVETSGKFGGLGIEVTIKDGLITVVSPIDDTPAYRAGIKSGDQLIKISGKPTKNISLAEAVSLMRGKPGSKLAITIYRKGAPKTLDFVLARESIKIQSVKYARMPSDIGYFRISSFMERTGEELARGIEKLNKDKKLTGVILDLRGNPGGLLDQAVRVANVFIEEGPIVYTIGRDRTKKETEFAQKGRSTTDLPLVVLVDGSSASASEIVAGALQDYGRGIIAGQQTFGKGSVQTVVPLGDESGLKLTVSRYYTPSGRSIQVKGIAPDVRLDYIDPKTVDEARKGQRRVREADLEGHFSNEGDPDAEKSFDDNDRASPGATAVEKESPSEKVMTLEDKIKKDYMISQAEGILKTMGVVRKGVKKPEFKLQEEPDDAATRAQKSASS